MAGWSASALAHMLHIPVPTVTNWIRYGLVQAEEYGQGRKGHVIGVQGLLELLAVMQLRQAGFPIREIRRAVDNLRDMSGNPRPLARLTLVIDGNDIAWDDRGFNHAVESVVSALRQPGQRLMLFPVGEVHASILKQLEEAPEMANSQK